MKKKKDINYLVLTPARKYDSEDREDGFINILIPRYTDFFFGKLLQPRLKNKYIRANLDEYGSAVWQEINGSTNVEQIGNKLENRFGERIQPVLPRLTTFLTQIYDAGFITFNELERK